MASLKIRASNLALLGALVSAVSAAACTGQLGKNGGRDASPGDGDAVDPTDLGAWDGKDGPVDVETGEPLRVQPLVVSRLNRAEYNNTVQDLLGSSLVPASSFPVDGMGDGFETVGSALSLSPVYVIAYEQAAHELMDELFSSSPEHRQEIVHCDAEQGEVTEATACARSIVSDFARRAFRRPVTDEDINPLLLPFETALELGATRTEGLRHSLAAVLLSPHFIFKIELDGGASGTEPHALSSHELATRLSYTLWSTMPDAELFAAAEADALGSDAELAAQVDRMLADPRSDALLDSFAGRWLEFSHLETHEVNADLYPEFSANLATSMRGEAEHFVRDFLRSSAPAPEMLTAGFTYVNAELASYYGLPFEGENPNDFVRVETDSTERAGLLTLGAILTRTSFSSRTSVVRRGEFVFSKVLCDHVPPPPPGVEGIPMDDADGLTLRQKLEQHRADPSCFGCHSLMDPLGFGLEHYDAIGRYRTLEGTLPVDASGVMPDGKNFYGVQELSEILSEDVRHAECITNKFLTYAGGRLLKSRNDEAWVSYLTLLAQNHDGGSLRAVIRSILLSEPFRTRVSGSAQ